MTRTLDNVGDRWTILILRDLLSHASRRFQQLETSLRGICYDMDFTDSARQLTLRGAQLMAVPSAD